MFVIIFIGALSGQTFEITEPDIDDIAGSVENESVNALNDTTVSLGHDMIQTHSFYIINTTGGTFPSSNYTLDATAGTVSFDTRTTEGQNGTSFVYYQYGDTNVTTAIKDSILAGFQGFKASASYMPIFILAIIIVVVLSLVVGFTGLTGMFRGGGGNNAL